MKPAVSRRHFNAKGVGASANPAADGMCAGAFSVHQSIAGGKRPWFGKCLTQGSGHLANEVYES